MAFPILGLHHVTATVDEAQPDLDFCVGTLGLRLVKKTVNFDNHHVYHFYYGDAAGRPGSIWTTFPYHGRGVRVGTKGTGQVTATSFSVPVGAIDFWAGRLRSAGADLTTGTTSLGEPIVMISDPSGLHFELIGADDTRKAWADGCVDGTTAIRGLHSVTMTVRDAAPSVAFMTEWLGYQVVAEQAGLIRLAVNGGGPGRYINIRAASDAPPAINGIGTVHHVAMAIADESEQLRLRQGLTDHGLQVTPVMDRQYFKSIYFREPGGVLFEVATMAPGFTVDEPLEALGRDLKLPPWEEPHRQEIERGLAKVHY